MTAKLIAHSTYEGGPDLATVQATGRRFILAELNTHRALSKNSASSRAIPFPKQVQKIIDGLAYPEIWAAEQKGMQGGDEIADVESARELWEMAASEAVAVAQDLHGMGVHKSIVNRLLEPFMWHTVVMTGTAWENFFNQRCSPLAQPEIRVMAEEIRTAVQSSEPEVLREDLGMWHTPYIEKQDGDEAIARARGNEREAWFELVKVSAARCARVSYLTQEGKRDMAEDLDLFDKLTKADPPHWSPLEHVATPWPANRQVGFMTFPDFRDARQFVPTNHLPRVGNLLGWRSLRTTVEADRQEVTFR